jgi:two-component system, NtrC family, nitrogen regulation sensor histidine kinase GlnL
MNLLATGLRSASYAELPDMFELLSTAAVVLDGHFRLVRLNASAEALLELSTKQTLGHLLAEIWPSGLTLQNIARRSLESRGVVSDRELPIRLMSGRQLTVDCTATPLSDSSATADLGESAVVLELVHVDRTLRINRDEHLLAQNEIARNLVRGLAHEIRNPLGGIRGAAQLLERELPNADLREYTRVIIGEADRLQRLLDRLLGPRALPELRQVNVHEVAERVLALLEAEVPTSVSVERDYDPSLPTIVGDAELLIQALLNVARNAAQAVGEEGTIRVCTRIERYCTVGTTHHRMAVRIDVEDDGPGVPPELIDSLFYPLVTGRSEGTGLGLSIAQSLLHQHGGIIEFRPAANKTVFSLLIPMEKAL